MNKNSLRILSVFIILLCLAACGRAEQTPLTTKSEGTEENASTTMAETEATKTKYTRNTRIRDVINDAAFEDYGRLIFPVNTSYFSGNTLGDLSLTWYSEINPDKTVEICNYFREQAENGEQIFYDIYTDSEKKADSEKKNTGLFFFRGKKCKDGNLQRRRRLRLCRRHARQLSPRA